VPVPFGDAARSLKRLPMESYCRFNGANLTFKTIAFFTIGFFHYLRVEKIAPSF
jgi:hypothetical protein